jgi:hypothetical protein
VTDQTDEVGTEQLDFDDDSNTEPCSVLPTCPNCGAELFHDPAPRLPLILPADGRKRIYRYCAVCWKKVTLVLAVSTTSTDTESELDVDEVGTTSLWKRSTVVDDHS